VSGRAKLYFPHEAIFMKLIVAVIRPYKLQIVKEALSKVGVAGVTVTDVRGSGRQKGQIERYRGSEYSVDLIAKCRIEIAVADDQAEDAIEAICKSAHTGEIGDGKIFTLPLEESIRIRTGERGEDSL
jgi:nitrogen regulatory protein PII